MGAEDYSNPLAPTPPQEGEDVLVGRGGGGTTQSGGGAELAGSPWGGQQPPQSAGRSGQPSPALSEGTTLDPAGVINLIRTLVDVSDRFSLGTPSPGPSRPR